MKKSQIKGGGGEGDGNGFHVLGTFDEAPVILQSSGVRADAQ